MNKTKISKAFSWLIIMLGLIGTINYYALYQDEKAQKDDVKHELIAVVQTKDNQLATVKKNLANQQSTNAELIKQNQQKQAQLKDSQNQLSNSQAQLKNQQAQIDQLNNQLEQAKAKK